MIMASIAMLSLAVLFAFIVWLIYKKFWVEIDPKLDKAINMLTGLNCGACGFASCESFARALSKGQEARCPMLDGVKMSKIYDALGVKGSNDVLKKALVFCKAFDKDKEFLARYKGIKSCYAANLNSAYQSCSYGCLGFGDCVEVCPVSAIRIEKGLAVIDIDSCIGCGLCVKECPRGIIQLIDYNGKFIPYVACSNKDSALRTKEICKVGCIGCGICVKLSSEGTFKVEDNLARATSSGVDLSREEEYKKVSGKCPMSTIDIKYSQKNREYKFKRKRFAVFASGEGSNLKAIIGALKSRRIEAELSLVISDNIDATALKIAQKAGIESLSFNPENYKNKEDYESFIIKELKRRDIDFIVLAGFMRVLSPYFVSAYKDNILNIHPALLPSFPGRHGVRDALKAGVDKTGVTVHFVDQGVDSGPIIVQDIEPVKKGDTEESLLERLHKIEHRLYPEVIDLFAKGKISINNDEVKIIKKGE
jgi:formyltetrahydrofolate-dependent phosphoribosylglycinamide formyltransferase